MGLGMAGGGISRVQRPWQAWRASCAGWAQGRAAGGFCQGPGAHEVRQCPSRVHPGGTTARGSVEGDRQLHTVLPGGRTGALEKRWVEAAGGAARSGPSSWGWRCGGRRGEPCSLPSMLWRRGQGAPMEVGVHACTRARGLWRQACKDRRTCVLVVVCDLVLGFEPCQRPRPCRGGCSAGQKQWLTHLPDS